MVEGLLVFNGQLLKQLKSAFVRALCCKAAIYRPHMRLSRPSSPSSSTTSGLYINTKSESVSFTCTPTTV